MRLKTIVTTLAAVGAAAIVAAAPASAAQTHSTGSHATVAVAAGHTVRPNTVICFPGEC